MVGKRLRNEVLEQTRPLVEAKIAFMNTISPAYTFTSDMRYLIHVQYKPEDQFILDQYDKNIKDMRIQLRRLVITPETDFEKKPLSVKITIGSFYECQGGYVRQGSGQSLILRVLTMINTICLFLTSPYPKKEPMTNYLSDLWLKTSNDYCTQKNYKYAKVYFILYCDIME